MVTEGLRLCLSILCDFEILWTIVWQSGTDKLKFVGVSKWGNEDTKGSQGCEVSTCLNVWQVKEKHQSQICWLQKQLNRDFYSV
jgi:hypothetical protein